MSDRARRLADRAAQDDLVALVVGDLVDVRWLTGFTGSAAAAVVGTGGLRRFVTDVLYLTQSREQLDDTWEREIATEQLPALAQALPAGRVGFDEAQTTVKALGTLTEHAPEGVELVAVSGLVAGLRAIKDADEIGKLRAAARLADAALEEVLERGLAGRTERDVALDLEVTMRRRGATGVSFAPIVAAGAHSALPHAEPRDVEIPRGTLCTIDWGCMLDGYASDCTRTFGTGGDLDPRDRDVYEVVLVAQERALAAVAPGAAAREVDAVARDLITAAGHGEHFGHGLGHGVGAEVHEGPRLSQRSDATLAAGHVVTVEPGVYVPGAVGVRIEDLVVVTDDGHDVLTALPKGLRSID